MGGGTSKPGEQKKVEQTSIENDALGSDSVPAPAKPASKRKQAKLQARIEIMPSSPDRHITLILADGKQEEKSIARPQTIRSLLNRAADAFEMKRSEVAYLTYTTKDGPHVVHPEFPVGCTLYVHPRRKTRNIEKARRKSHARPDVWRERVIRDDSDDRVTKFVAGQAGQDGGSEALAGEPEG